MPNMGAGVMPEQDQQPGMGPGGPPMSGGGLGGIGGSNGELPDLGNLMEQMQTGQCTIT